MRGTAGPQIGFLYPAVATPLRAQGAVCGEESLQSESRARHCGLELGGQWRGPSVGSPAASSLTIVGHPGLALTAVRGPSGLFGIQLRADTKLPARLTRSCGPGDTGWQGALPPMDSSEAPGPGREAAGGERAKGTWTKGCLSSEEGNGSRCNLESGPRVPSAPAGSQDGFTSSFSFIRLSLSSAGERGEAEGCPPSRDAEAPCQSPVETEAKDASLDRPHAHPRLLSPHFNVKAAQSLADPAQMAAGSPRLECETRSLPDVDTASSCPLVPSWSEGSGVGDAPRWETLLRRCEPVLLDCLLSDQRQLEVGVFWPLGPVIVTSLDPFGNWLQKDVAALLFLLFQFEHKSVLVLIFSVTRMLRFALSWAVRSSAIPGLTDVWLALPSSALKQGPRGAGPGSGIKTAMPHVGEDAGRRLHLLYSLYSILPRWEPPATVRRPRSWSLHLLGSQFPYLEMVTLHRSVLWLR